MARLLSLPTSGQNAEVVKARALQLSQEILFIAPVGKGEGQCGEIGGRAGGGASVHCCAVCARTEALGQEAGQGSSQG